jgi:hypothetical protein
VQGVAARTRIANVPHHLRLVAVFLDKNCLVGSSHSVSSDSAIALFIDRALPPDANVVSEGLREESF